MSSRPGLGPLLVAGLCAVTLPLLAAEPRLVRDINPFAEPASSKPGDFVAIGKVTIFAAEDEESGREIWRSDGTATGTYRVADVCPGPCSSAPGVLAATPAGVFFTAVDEASETRRLWISRGTTGDAVRLSVGTMRQTGNPVLWSSAHRKLFFTAFDDTGEELWVSDGTPQGTRRYDLRPGNASSSPSAFVVLGGRVLFVATPDGLGGALWASDGTAAGTVLIKDTMPGARQGRLAFLAALGKRAVFFADNPKNGFELWSSDGTTRGTSLLVDLVRGKRSPTVKVLRAVSGRAFFVAGSGNQGEELWVTDGTAKGTRVLTNFGPTFPFGVSTQVGPLFLLPYGSGVFFGANDGDHGSEPWTSNGTPQGTKLVADICPGPCSGGSFPAGIAGQKMLFDADDGIHGFELWSTDGTAAGTRLVVDLCPGPCSKGLVGLGRVGSKALLAAVSLEGEGARYDAWVSDGSAAGTVDLGVSLGVRFGNHRLESLELGSQAVLAGVDDAHGLELWRTDGTPAGTRLLADINGTDLGGSFPEAFQPATSHLYFFANDGVHGFEPWRTDGTEAGTQLVGELTTGAWPIHPPSRPAVTLGDALLVSGGPAAEGLWRIDGNVAPTRLSPEGLQVQELIRAGDRAWFRATAPAAYETLLWSTDGTPEGTRQVDLGVEVNVSTIVEDEGTLYFAATTSDLGEELWKSDGTAAGTSLVADVEPNGSSHPRTLTRAAGRWFFIAQGQFMELWRSDGTSAGTVRLASLPGVHFDFGQFSRVVPLGSRVLFFLHHRGVWVSDGTPEGTRRLASAMPVDQDLLASPAVVGGVAYFEGVGPAGSGILWRTDGSDEGTYPLLTREGQTIDDPSALRSLGGKLYWVGRDRGDLALWVSDGSPAGTRIVTPLRVLWTDLAVFGGQLFFRTTGPEGVELWALPGN
jgi:ELWxxDGT repeat protein